MGRRQQGSDNPLRWHDLTDEERELFLSDAEYADYFVGGDANTIKHYSKEQIDQAIDMAKRKECNYYGETDQWLYDALDEHPIKDLSVAVIGSVEPWYESMCLAYGAKPCVIEYNKLSSDDDRITYITVDEYESNPVKFDAVISISSFEHDGLGRYGDPICPEGDLLAMKNVRDNILKPGGLLFLAVPLGKDKIAWNAHRIYGKNRLPKLIDNFDIVSTYPTDIETMMNKDTKYGRQQPVLVLRSK